MPSTPISAGKVGEDREIGAFMARGADPLHLHARSEFDGARREQVGSLGVRKTVAQKREIGYAHHGFRRASV